MQLLKGLAIIFGFSFIGDLLSNYLSVSLPGSIIGLLLLFISLKVKIIKLKDVEDVSDTLQKNMAFLFVPLVVSLSLQFDLFKDSYLSLIAIILITTVITYIFVAKVSEKVLEDE